MSKKHYNLKITGDVQGVGLRYSSKIKADELNICGFIKNLPDGSVYLEAEGEEKDLKKFLDYCPRGYSSARVDDVQVEENNLRNYTNFTINY